MKENIKITAFVGLALLSSFVILIGFLDMYTAGLLTTEKNILDVENIFEQNPKQATINVLQDLSGESKVDTININSLGFRGEEFSNVKPPNTYRIFMVGSSPMFGYGASSDETTIPGFMQKFLSEKDFDFDIEVADIPRWSFHLSSKDRVYDQMPKEILDKYDGEFLGERVLDSTDLLRLSSMPASLAVVGGGYIGVELGTAFAKLGARVCMVEACDRLLPLMRPFQGEAVQRRLASLGARVMRGAQARERTQGGLRVETAAGPEEIEAAKARRAKEAQEAEDEQQEEGIMPLGGAGGGAGGGGGGGG